MRLSVNADLVFNSTPPTPLRQHGHNCGFAVEMTRRGNRGKVLPRLFHRRPPRLEIAQKRRDYHIPAATTTPGGQSPPKSTPAQIAGLFTFWWRTLITLGQPVPAANLPTTAPILRGYPK